MRSGASISVILRTLNRNERLGEALESLVNQTRRDFEVVIVDMSWKGDAASVLEHFRKRLPQVKHLPAGKPLSRGEALNQGIRAASADKIAILDDDNLYDPTHLEVLVEGLERTGADLVYTGARRTTHTRDGHLIEVVRWHHPYDFTQLLFRNYILTVGTAFWKRLWEGLGGYDPRFPVYEDYEFLLRAGAAGRIESLPAVTAESRSFTGQPGRANHSFETRHTRRCRAGIYWVHRNLFFSPKRRAAYAAYSAHVKAKMKRASGSRGGVLIRWLLLCGEMGLGLLDWCLCDALPSRIRGKLI
jgi:glycosyltransferase involved in cell wall biosynthesis